MGDTTRRLVLRVTLKLLALAALVIIVYALLSSIDNDKEQRVTSPSMRIDLLSLQPARPQRIEWPGGPLQLLRMQQGDPLYLFYDRGGNLGCPLAWQAAGSREAPLQPWPGGFRDQCSSVWYRYDGKVLPNQASGQNLQGPAYRIKSGHLLEIGINGDNAAPATPPES